MVSRKGAIEIAFFLCILGYAAYGAVFAQSPEELDQSEIEEQIHEEVNDRREDHGVETLTYDERIGEIAEYHSEDMSENDYYSHNSPGGEGISDRFQKFNYSCEVYGENIRLHTEIYGKTESEIAETAVKSWMNSDGHRENILHSEFSRQGIGVEVGEFENGTSYIYMTQNFCG